jgi:hypothetical protein
MPAGVTQGLDGRQPAVEVGQLGFQAHERIGLLPRQCIEPQLQPAQAPENGGGQTALQLRLVVVR